MPNAQALASHRAPPALPIGESAPPSLMDLAPAHVSFRGAPLEPALLPGSWHALAIDGVLSLAHARLDAHRFVRPDGIDAACLLAFRDFALESLHDLAWVIGESSAQSPWPGPQAKRAHALEAHRSTLSGLIEQLDVAIADCTLLAAYAVGAGVPTAVGHRLALLKEVEDAVVAHFAVGPGVPDFGGDLHAIGRA